MNTPRNRYLLFAAAMLLFVLACGGGMEPDTEPIAVFPEAEEATEDDSFVVGILESMADSLSEQEDFETTTAFYELPQDVTFEEIEQFYDEELSGRDWTQLEDSPEIEGGGIAGWERGSDQAFFVMVMPDELNGTTIMMTMEARR